MNLRRIFSKSIKITALIVVTLWSLLPIYYTILVSLLPKGAAPTNLYEMFDFSKVTLEYYSKVLFSGREKNPLWRPIVNSFAVSILTTFVCAVVAAPAAYFFSRVTSRKSKMLFFAFFIIRGIPGYAVIVPFFLLLSRLKLIDTILGLSISYIPWRIALAIWLFKGFFDMIPRDFEEAAQIDGASHLEAIFRIIVPLALPGIIAGSVFVFLSCYIEYMYAAAFTRFFALTIPVKIAGYSTQHRLFYEEMCAATIVALIPMAIMYLLVQKRITTVFTLGVVKK